MTVDPPRAPEEGDRRKTYQNGTTTATSVEQVVLPESVTVAVGELAGQWREGLLAMAVGAGLQVGQVWMAESMTALCGPRGKHDPTRTAVRHGSERGSMTLGERRVPVRRPRVQTADGTSELPVPAYELFTSTEILDAMAVERMLGKLSTRRYLVGLEPVGAEGAATASGTSKSAVSRRFVAATERARADLVAAELTGLDLVALMVDGVHVGEHRCVVALGITADGTKHPLALAEGSTKNATLVRELLVDLRERGLDGRPGRSWS